MSTLREQVKENVKETAKAGRDAAVSRIKAAHADILDATSIRGWEASPVAKKAIEAAKAEIEAALASVPEAERESTDGLGRFYGRVEAARRLKGMAENATPRQIGELTGFFVAIVRDAIAGKNVIQLPYADEQRKDETTGAVPEVTLEWLRGQTVSRPGKAEGETITGTRDAEVLFGLGDLRAAPAEGEKRGRALAFHAPSFQGSKGVQALVLNLQKTRSRIASLARDAAERRGDRTAEAQLRDGRTVQADARLDARRFGSKMDRMSGRQPRPTRRAAPRHGSDE